MTTTKLKANLDEAEAVEMSYHNLGTLLLYTQWDKELSDAGLPSLEEMYQNCRKGRVRIPKDSFS